MISHPVKIVGGLPDGRACSVEASPLETALAAELTAIVNKPLSPEMLRELETMTKAVRNVLQAKLHPGVRLARAMHETEEPFVEEPIGTFENKAETFGATALREIVSNMKAKEKRDDIGCEAGLLIRAIADAKTGGNMAVATALQKNLNALVGIPEDGTAVFDESPGRFLGEPITIRGGDGGRPTPITIYGSGPEEPANIGEGSAP